MRNLEIIKNKNGGYGIRDLDSGIVIIPSMYKRKQLEHITEIVPLGNFFGNLFRASYVFVLIGYDIDNNIVYGLYNSFTNDFIDVIYNKLHLVMDKNFKPIANMIKFIKDNAEKIYDSSVSQDNIPVEQKVKVFTSDNKTYGLVTADGKEIIPEEYSRREIFNIGDIVEICEGLYILKDKDNLNRIVGFYDSSNKILKKGTFTSYEIISDVLVFKNRIVMEEPRKIRTDELLVSKTFISFYDPKNGRYIDGDYYEQEVSIYYSEGYRDGGYYTRFHKCLDEVNGVLILNSRAFYDTRTGYWQDNVFCRKENGKIKIWNPHDGAFIGYYDIEQKSVERFMQLSCEGLEEYTSVKLYLSHDGKKFNFGGSDCFVEEYSDFIMISYEDITILLGKDYNFLSYEKKKLNILEIKPETVERLGIPAKNDKSVYLIRGELYTFRKSSSLAIKGRIFPNFVKISSKVVGAVEYEYGICSVEADNAMDLDHKLDELERKNKELSLIVEQAFYQDKTLMNDYPKLVKKKN